MVICTRETLENPLNIESFVVWDVGESTFITVTVASYISLLYWPYLHPIWTRTWRTMRLKWGDQGVWEWKTTAALTLPLSHWVDVHYGPCRVSILILQARKTVVLTSVCTDKRRPVPGDHQDGLDRRLTALVMISIGHIQVMNKLKNNLHLDHKNHTMGATWNITPFGNMKYHSFLATWKITHFLIIYYDSAGPHKISLCFVGSSFITRIWHHILSPFPELGIIIHTYVRSNQLAGGKAV